MPEPTATLLSAWESFYVIVGSSAGALTGLMFVVIAIVADNPRSGSQGTMGAYGTPTVVHFCAALFISSVLSAPWRSVEGASWTLFALGAFGLGYVSLVMHRARKQQDYKPVFEDWLWHTLLPYIAYVTVVIAGIAMHKRPDSALFGIAGGALLLLFIGIHNSWDTVTYIALDLRQKTEARASAASVSAATAPAGVPEATAPAAPTQTVP